MSNLADIEQALDQLTLDELRTLEQVIQAKASARLDDGSQPRKPCLHAGIWTVAEDFDAPLPDEFWLGTEK